MKIREARLWPFRLRLKRSLATARGPLRHRKGILLRLTTDSGAVGWGEAMPLESFGTERIDESKRALEILTRPLLGRDARELGELLEALTGLAPRAPAARAAVDMALHDLAAQARHINIAQLLCEHEGRAPRPCVPISALLSGSNAAELENSSRRAVALGIRHLKLKVGAGTLDRDEDRVRAVRCAVGNEVALRLDANGAWEEAEARSAIERLAPFGIEFIEEPLASGEPAALARLRRVSPIGIAADESVRSRCQARALLAHGAVDHLVLKPAALGGLRAAREIADLAREARVRVVVTSFLDSTLGIVSALHLASALPGESSAAGLATGSLFAEDLAPALPVREGVLGLPQRSGLGVAPDPRALRSLGLGTHVEVGH